VAEKLIFALAAVAVVVLFIGMKHELAAPDPTRPPTFNTILTTIHARNLTCDNIDGFRFLDSNKGWDFYMAHCRDGGRFIYMQSAIERKVFVRSCTEEAQLGYYCPQE